MSGSRPTPSIGWREWVQLTDLGGCWVKAKVDTGARSSALHAFRLEHFERDHASWVRFEVHPRQRSSADAVVVESPVLETRAVRSSNGQTEQRPVITTSVRMGDQVLPLELTLTRRDAMGFRMLLGRRALRGRYLVDPGSSYRFGRRRADGSPR